MTPYPFCHYFKHKNLPSLKKIYGKIKIYNYLIFSVLCSLKQPYTFIDIKD